MSYVGGRAVLGDVDPFAAYHAMETAAAQAIADQAAHPAAPVEQYRDFATGQDVSVDEGRRLLNADYVKQAVDNANSIAATPGYAGGGEDFVKNQVANAWAITRASQGFTDLTSPVPLPPAFPASSGLHPVVVVPPPPVPGATNGSPGAGGGSSSSNPGSTSATANYPPSTVTFAPTDRPNIDIRPVAPSAATPSGGIPRGWLLAGGAAAVIGLGAFVASKPTRRR